MEEIWTLPSPSAMWGHSEKPLPVDQGQADTESVGALVLDFPVCRTVRNKSSVVYSIMLQQPIPLKAAEDHYNRETKKKTGLQKQEPRKPGVSGVNTRIQNNCCVGRSRTILTGHQTCTHPGTMPSSVGWWLCFRTLIYSFLQCGLVITNDRIVGCFWVKSWRQWQ